MDAVKIMGQIVKDCAEYTTWFVQVSKNQKKNALRKPERLICPKRIHIKKVVENNA